MKRKEFLRNLKDELNKRRDIESGEVLFYYDELIQDALDNGNTEDVFIENLGSPREIVRRLEDDKEFVSKVKVSNDKYLKNAVGTTIKVIGYFIIGIFAFVIGTTSFSLFISGVAVVIACFVKMLINGPMDMYAYLVLAGGVLIGLSLLIFSLALAKWFLHKTKPALLSIFRNTKDFINGKGRE